jgi:hypothetical protein
MIYIYAEYLFEIVHWNVGVVTANKQVRLLRRRVSDYWGSIVQRPPGCAGRGVFFSVGC